ncbi:alpha/beta fold hydrolase [Nocardia sp. XZ_19_385]|uniref:alpha/beta fold hydrolase n=1 Tax=Nocardia sp. XZ_19_385 TaxID=2769488 RepID=UPI00188E27F3|nr:alpha/beta fold hydrolase [Nocardia sp. XZ_19_385]
MTTNSYAVRQFTVRHEGVTIPVSRGGQGRTLVLCPGLTSSQGELHELIDLLRRDFEVVSFDLRGHGLSSAADRYSFEAFLGDLGAVLAELGRSESPPVLAGHSYGADLIVHYAAAHPDAVAELMLIDGANPLPEPFITEADLPEFQAMWESLAPWHETNKGTPRQMLLTPTQILELNVELDGIRAGLLDQYRKIECAISMIMASAMAGDSAERRTPRHNQLWREGMNRLIQEQPHIRAHWLEASHGLVVTHAADVARIIRAQSVNN